MIFSTAAEMLFSDREAVYGFVETPQNVFGAGIRAAQGYPDCHDIIAWRAGEMNEPNRPYLPATLLKETSKQAIC